VPDYRLYPEVRFPAFLEDSAKSVAWTQTHLAEIGGDPSRVFVMGHSAGAYNAVMLGLDASFLKQAGSSRDSIAGIIGLAGPYDFLPITGADIKPIFATVNDGPQSQPISYVDGHAPPMLLLAGADDTTVLPKNTISLAARITAKGGSVQSRIFPGLGHIGLITAIAPIFQGRAPVLATVTDFISTHRLKTDAATASRAGAPAADEGRQPP
jgi:acetyl esterase/lipase